MLKMVLITATLLVANPDERAEVIGVWRSEPLPGVATIERLTFTPDGRLIAGQNRQLGRYVVAGRKVSAQGGGVTYAYELTEDGRLCVSPGPSLQPLADGQASALTKGQCYRKDAPAA